MSKIKGWKKTSNSENIEIYNSYIDENLPVDVRDYLELSIIQDDNEVRIIINYIDTQNLFNYPYIVNIQRKPFKKYDIAKSYALKYMKQNHINKNIENAKSFGHNLR